jgi:curved DNA-binding protein
VAADYYQVLGVSRDASAEELQQAYRKLARRNHPDVNKDPAAEDRFKEINEAYHVLADPKLRERYDRYGPQFRSVPEDMDERYAGAGAGFGGGAGRRGGGPQWSRTGRSAGPGGGFSSEGGPVDLEDLFGDLFGAGRGGGAAWNAGVDQEAELVLPVEEAYRGGRHRISLGSRSYEVNIPAGVVDGQRIRLGGEGGQGRGGAPGDLYLVVRIAPHPRFRVSGRDITVNLPLAPWEAALGASVPVETPGGEAKVTVPAGSSSGRRLRLRGQGMPSPRGKPGDLYAEVKIMVPDRLSETERALFDELSRVSTFDPRRSR